MHGVILRTFDEVLRDGRPEVLSVGFVVSVWSGSRALGVVLDTVSIMYGLGGRRGIVRTRALSLVLYVLALAAGVLVLPLLLLGPGLLASFTRERLGAGALGAGGLSALYWPAVAVLVTAGLAAVYRVAPPVPTTWRRCLPGAALALGLWVLASVALRAVVGGWIGRGSVYGPLAAPVALLVWLYLLALAVLVGAALNATLDATLHAIPPAASTPDASPPARSGSLPGAGRGVGDDGPQVRARHPEGGGHVGQPAPVGSRPGGPGRARARRARVAAAPPRSAASAPASSATTARSLPSRCAARSATSTSRVYAGPCERCSTASARRRSPGASGWAASREPAAVRTARDSSSARRSAVGTASAAGRKRPRQAPHSTNGAPRRSGRSGSQNRWSQARGPSSR